MVSAIILAAGEGRRIGFKKQFFKIGGKPILYHSIEVFKLLGIEDIVIVIPKDIPEDIKETLRDFKVVEGGKERMDSVYNGVKAAKGEYVLVHDSARANISIDVVKRVLYEEGECVIPVIRPSDSVIYRGEYVNRDETFLVQTPQKVKRDLYIKAYEMAGGRVFPDEGSLILEVLGIKPKFVEGDRWNFKITYRDDLEVFMKMKTETLFAFGYDIHKLVKGIPLYLGGIKVSDDFGALGHSDGDVIIHSIVDAALSSLGYGDIGSVFPDDDPRWKGARSEVFAEITMDILKKEGWRIKNADIVVILSRPKISPFREKIIENLKRIFGLERVSLKAKSGNTFFEDAVQCYAFITLTPLEYSYEV